MKAWMVGDIDNGYYLVHAETRGKAKYRALRHTDLGLFHDWEGFRYVHAKRAKILDGQPFTLENALKVLLIPEPVDEEGYRYTGEFATTEDYINQCPCDICKRF